VSGTFAKYTTAVSGKDTVRVAKFDVAVGDGATTFTTGTAIDIFTMAADTGVSSVTADGKKIIAPGTTGDFTIEIENKSEVAVGIDLTLSETNAGNVPIYYVYDGKRYSSKLTGAYTGDDAGSYANLAALEAAIATDLEIPATANGVAAAPYEAELDWFWAFESAGAGQTDVSDTTLGTAGTAEVTLTITVTATQLDTYTP
ncbi:MAG: hypothetical protein PHE79_10205, partial [Eubacteriales bacterium]|nr:hypothetical protein [Eubacteriales bacterium]